MTRDAVTGAFGFTGRHIAARLLAEDRAVLNLTNHPGLPDPFRGRVPTAPLAFSNAGALADSLRGVDTLYNTYWVRFPRGRVTHADAVVNSTVLFAAARVAGVRRIVHISIANPSPTSPLSYYRGKAAVEAALAASGLSHAILRPAVLFGDEPILFNSIAWLLRRLLVFGIPGDGRYSIQPIHVDDLTRLAVDFGRRDDDVTIDAAGPEGPTFTELVRFIRESVGSRTRIVHVSPAAALGAAWLLGHLVHDVMLTGQELDGLRDGLLVSHQPPLGETRLSDWLASVGPWLGRHYLPEVSRHFLAAA